MHVPRRRTSIFHGPVGVLSGFHIPTNPILNLVDVD